ncbi:MAG: dihydrofolate reductase family protein [Thaumarchaeota archaeon]|nr:dihydrofolate reductase family protein [Nitrososphaerota archaeon]
MVFSKTLEKAEWQNSRLVSVKTDDDVAKEVVRLKEQPGGDMVVFGGARFAQTLSKLGVIDEYRLKLQPVALGAGLPLFKDFRSRVGLRLVKSQAFKSGVVALCYQPAK